jgi:hypothetical protein
MYIRAACCVFVPGSVLDLGTSVHVPKGDWVHCQEKTIQGGQAKEQEEENAHVTEVIERKNDELVSPRQ